MRKISGVRCCFLAEAFGRIYEFKGLGGEEMSTFEGASNAY